MILMKNIYESKHYKLFILIPIAMLLISLYFIPHIQLDSTLKGGVSVQLQTNSTINTRSLTTLVDSKIVGAQASVERSPGGLEVTMAANTSLANAQADLLAFYTEYGNYTTATYNITAIQSSLSTQPSNTTLQGLLATSKTEQQQSIVAFNKSIAAELVELRPFIGVVSYNASDYTNLPNVAKDSYSNASLIYQNKIVATLHTIIPFTSDSYQEVTPTLGAFFLSQMETIIIVAFILIAITVLIIFRTPIPAFAVVFGAANDLIVALGAMGILGIPLGVASIGGLLMLLGFSIDTDILAAVRILKRTEGTAESRAWSSLKTGTTMTITAIISFSVLFAISYYAFIPTYVEISGVVLVGLIGDMITTWLTDVPLVLWYKKSKEVHGK
jgi:preprotein translocase subunit SecF